MLEDNTVGAVFAYPLFLAVNARAPLAQRRVARVADRVSKRVTGPAIGVIFFAGAYLASDGDLWSEPWVLIAVALLLVIAAYARALAIAQRWTSVTLALLVVAIFVMTAKPFG